MKFLTFLLNGRTRKEKKRSNFSEHEQTRAEQTSSNVNSSSSLQGLRLSNQKYEEELNRVRQTPTKPVNYVPRPQPPLVEHRSIEFLGNDFFFSIGIFFSQRNEAVVPLNRIERLKRFVKKSNEKIDKFK